MLDSDDERMRAYEPALCSISRCVTVHTWASRRGADAKEEPIAEQLELREVDGMGRSMFAVESFVPGQPVVRELPVVIGRCCITHCPGCPTKYRDEHAPQCFWALVEAEPSLKSAVMWHRDVSGQVDSLPLQQQANHVRICCLLAICMQAAAHAGLREWLLEALRPSLIDVNDKDNPIVTNTRGFAEKFALRIAVPAEIRASSPHPVVAWTEELFRLLINLQTNLFDIDSRAIGIYPSTFLYAHSCNPNTRLTQKADDVIGLTAIRKIDRGEAVTFSYHDDRADGAKRDDLEPRRRCVSDGRAGVWLPAQSLAHMFASMATLMATYAQCLAQVHSRVSGLPLRVCCVPVRRGCHCAKPAGVPRPYGGCMHSGKSAAT